MNNTPAWLTIAVAGTTALVAILTASITTWLNVRSANKRSAAELQQQRERFTQELEHQREIEQRKLVHDARQKAYLELVECSYVMHKFIRVLETNGPKGMPAENWKYVDRFQSAILACRALGGSAVGEMADALMIRVEKFAEATGEARVSDYKRTFDARAEYEPVRELYAEMAKAVRADLGVLDGAS